MASNHHAGAQSLRCSLCGITYPPLPAHDVCDLCSEPTSPFSNVKPDDDWQEQVERVKKLRAGGSTSSKAKIDHHRFERLTALGLGAAQAIQVAGDHSINLHEFEDKYASLIANGCAPAMAFDILS